MDYNQFKARAEEHLSVFYRRRIQQLEKTTLSDLLGSPDYPFLKLIGTTTHNFIKGLLSAYLDSLDGGLFGPALFKLGARDADFRLNLIRLMETEIIKPRQEYDLA